MSATITKEVYIGNRIYLKSLVLVLGTGSPADSDNLVQIPKHYPIGTEYIDLNTKYVYKRVATGLTAAGDFILCGNNAIPVAADVAAVATANATDLPSAIALANQLKTSLNATLASIKAAGLMS